MSNSSGVISAPVSIADVQTVLGDTSTDLAALCTSVSINMWAKYKPIPDTAKFLNIKTDYQGTNYNCGITYGKTTSRTGIRALYDQTNNGYSYEKPTVYRLADFNGYNHTARAPITGYTFESSCVNTNFSCSCSVGISSIDGDTLTLKDILGDKDYYFGVGLYQGTNTSPAYFKTASTAYDYTVSFAGSALGTGTYTVVPFLSSVAYNSLSDVEQACTYIALPSISLKKVTLVTKASQLANLVTLTSSTSNVATVANDDTESHVVTVQLRFATSSWTDDMVSGEYVLISNKTIAAGASTSASFANYIKSGKTYALHFYIDSTFISSQVIMSQEIPVD